MSIEFSRITKVYGDVTANDDISFIIESGTIHALLGENGAGKTTLIKILTGQLAADSGKIIIDGDEIKNNAFLLSVIELVFWDKIHWISKISLFEKVFLPA